MCYNKYNLNILIRGYNVANQTGEYYSIVTIDYTFNGEPAKIVKTIKYRVVLPEVLDNEYLIATVTRLDSVTPPTETITTDDGKQVQVEVGTTVNDDSKELLENYFRGTAGCNKAYPDLNWFKLP